jgi:hypothetical protein
MEQRELGRRELDDLLPPMRRAAGSSRWAADLDHVVGELRARRAAPP